MYHVAMSIEHRLRLLFKYLSYFSGETTFTSNKIFVFMKLQSHNTIANLVIERERKNTIIIESDRCSSTLYFAYMMYISSCNTSIYIYCIVLFIHYIKILRYLSLVQHIT